MIWPAHALKIHSTSILMVESLETCSVGASRQSCVVTWVTRVADTNGRVSPMLSHFLAVVVWWVPLSRIWSKRFVVDARSSTRFVVQGCTIDQSRIDVDGGGCGSSDLCAWCQACLGGLWKVSCIRICHYFSDPSGFTMPHTSAHSHDTSPAPDKNVESGGKGKIVFAKTSSIMLMERGSLPDWRRHATPLKSPVTMSTCSCSITERTASNKFFPMPRFFAKWLMWSDIRVQ